ncbi:MAG TPA: GntR family transcriptional regulator [Povalibacter sp.]|nr:GntR family transcriptional regulator [Povalibacter sp.]
MFILKPELGIPIYRQLIDQVRRMVASGQLAPGTVLPSVRELADAHTVHPMTISKAYSQLEAEGLLERNRGKPMTVASSQKPQAGIAPRLKQIEPQVEQLVLASRQLDLREKDVTGLIKRKWEQDHE